ncbi:metabotropic glutamate receptor 4 [Trichonephila inaurata madagascariensis]|uniref:Metabotropic glutamate receptor 4 n=1 Tax=Trichonephila inaurata madagascariensis TaxID=2747483 RepID=A0A8X7C481_9ARAC|nr:metabotropic glutamate receptor 4 [Trichonephila inaurata madagascariensis]
MKYIVKFVTPPVAGFEDYFKSLNVETNKRNPWFAEYWEQTFSCKFPETKQTPWNKFAKECNGNEELSTVEGLEIEETINHASDSVLAFAYALKAMHADLCDGESGVCEEMEPLNRTMLLTYLKNVSFKGLDGVDFEFKKRDEPSGFKIFLLNEKDPKICEYVSGDYYESVTFVSLFEKFNFEGYKRPNPCVVLNRTIERKVIVSETNTFIGLLMLVAIVIFLVTGLLMCAGVPKKIQKTDGQLSCSCELRGVSLRNTRRSTTVVFKEAKLRDTSILEDSRTI